MPSEPAPRRAADRSRPLEIGTRRTLPGWAYTDAAIWEAEKQAIFYRHWHYVCHESALDAPGKYVTTAIHDQELFLTRGHDGEVRAFYNVCAHRGHPLVEGEGQKNRLVCPYHAWTYDLTGRLVGARGSNRTEGFVRSDICLSGVRVESMLGLLFVNLDPDAPSLAEYAGGLPDAIRAAVPGVEEMRPQRGTEYFGSDIAANWKAVMDNFLECYHCGPAHPTFCDLLDVEGTRHDFGTNYTHQYIPAIADDGKAPYPIDAGTDFTDGSFWLLYPNTTFGYLPGTPNFAVSRIDSLAPERCRRFSHHFGPPDVWTGSDEKRRRWAIDFVVAEDVAICEAVQRGMRSRGFDQGLYIVNPENEECTEECLRFFHRRYAAEMGEALTE